MKSNRFVFDTNSLVSALLISSSVSQRAFFKAETKGLLMFSRETILELNSVLIRSKFDKYLTLDERLDFIDQLETKSLLIETSSKFTDCRDSKDNKFLNLAFDCQASCIVTGDQDLLILNPFNNIAKISPSEFLNNFII